MDKGTELLEETKVLLRDRPASLSMQDVADAVGVSIAWLRLFARGKAKNPGVTTVGKLNQYLKAQNKKAG